jgi:hypothetical protein
MTRRARSQAGVGYASRVDGADAFDACHIDWDPGPPPEATQLSMKSSRRRGRRQAKAPQSVAEATQRQAKAQQAPQAAPETGQAPGRRLAGDEGTR